ISTTPMMQAMALDPQSVRYSLQKPEFSRIKIHNVLRYNSEEIIWYDYGLSLK
ncbi:20362_t:CDS:1, partial [Gigaspora margarita]